MNRKERRAARSRDTLIIHIGRLLPQDLNHGLPVACYVCNETHPGDGVGMIQRGRTSLHVPLCERCVVGDDTTNRILRKYFGTPHLKISDGEATPEQIDALFAKQNGTEH